MRKRSLKLLILYLAALALILGASVALMLALERTPGFQRQPESLRSLREDTDLQERFYLALEAFNQNKLAEADKLVEEYLAKRPVSVEAWQLKGSIAFRRGLYEDARQAFGQVVRLEPFNAAGLSNLSLTCLRLNRPEEAYNLAVNAAGYAPQNGMILLNAATASAGAGKKDEAIAYLKRAIDTGVPAEAISRERTLVEFLEQAEVMDALKVSPAEPSVPEKAEAQNNKVE